MEYLIQVGYILYRFKLVKSIRKPDLRVCKAT
jgi:hypothetical protein